MPSAAQDTPTVERVDVSVYTVPTDTSEADGTLAWNSTTLILVQAVSGPTTGTGWTYGSPATAEVVSKELADVVTGHPVLDVPGANEAMGRAVRNTGRPGLVAGPISAVDIALWDLKARLLGLPLVHLLGATVTDVPVYGSGGFTTYDQEQLTRQLRGWTQERGIAEQIREEARRQLYDPAVIQQRLEEVAQARDSGELSAEEAAELESELVRRLMSGGPPTGGMEG